MQTGWGTSALDCTLSTQPTVQNNLHSSHLLAGRLHRGKRALNHGGVQRRCAVRRLRQGTGANKGASGKEASLMVTPESA